MHRLKSIDYPGDFKKEIKKEFEDREDVINLLENGRYVLGKVLLSESQKRMDPFDVINHFKRGKQEEVLKAANTASRRWHLYRKWVSIMLKACDSLHEEDAPYAH